MKNENPFFAYALVSQLAFIIITPLLLFIWGGKWLVDTLSLPSWVHGVLILIGIVSSVTGMLQHLRTIIKKYGQDKKNDLPHDPKDYDFYPHQYRKKNDSDQNKG